ncbi:hypothetical protein C2G38_1397369 [Gigaspora rosea]|uniref:Uncharacterized protein n=1 Tax=Gigaspora rosea TaxID=44941 RepID=A0A397W5U5_9GLOM|nr:hypothetical protein C2G38_1397369 [Gigaspora rosea]
MLTHAHSLATQFADLDKITKVDNCYIFASIIDKNDRDIFSLIVGYVHEHMPLIVVHLKKPLHKKHKNSPIKVGWIIVGPPINFDIDQTKCPVMIKSGEIESSKNRNVIESCALNTCVLGFPEVNTKSLMHLSVYDINDINQLLNDEKVPQRTALFCCFNDADKSYQTCEFDQIIANWQQEQNIIRLDTFGYNQNFNILARINRKIFYFFFIR